MAQTGDHRGTGFNLQHNLKLGTLGHAYHPNTQEVEVRKLTNSRSCLTTWQVGGQCGTHETPFSEIVTEGFYSGLESD